MKRKIVRLLSWILVIFVILVTLNISVTSRQGINFRIHTIRLPLYLKVLDFFDRHYNYKLAVARIVGNSSEEQEKILKIFAWTHKNIRKQPEGYPVIDDHVWHTIIRGYGISDQSCDVFTTLCNYAGVQAFFNFIEGENNDAKLPLSFVEIKRKWYVFDPYNGIYFRNNKKGLADFGDIARGDWIIESIDASGQPGIDYSHYLKNIQHLDSSELTRSNTQSPFNRLKYEIRKSLK